MSTGAQLELVRPIAQAAMNRPADYSAPEHISGCGARA